MVASDGIALTGAGLGRGPAPAGGGSLAPAVGTAVLVMLIIQAGLVLKGNAPVLDGVLIDPDGYMRLARVEHLWRAGAWFEPVFPRISPPEGLAMHWTRPFDVLLLAGALGLSPLLGFKAGLYWWSVALGPLLQLASLVALVWAAAPLLRRAWLCLLPFFFIAQPGIFGGFALARPDHHGVQTLLFILLLGWTLRLLEAPGQPRAAMRAGLLSALALWVSVESGLIVALTVAALGLSWLAGERRALGDLLRHALTVCLALVAVLLIERGPGAVSETEVDRISLAHLTAFVLNLAFWLSMALLQERGLLESGAPRRAAAPPGWAPARPRPCSGSCSRPCSPTPWRTVTRSTWPSTWPTSRSSSPSSPCRARRGPRLP